jgi:hypothetical protein
VGCSWSGALSAEAGADCSCGAAGAARWSTTIAAAEASSTPSKVPPSQPTADAIKPLLLDAPSDTSACSRKLQVFKSGVTVTPQPVQILPPPLRQRPGVNRCDTIAASGQFLAGPFRGGLFPGCSGLVYAAIVCVLTNARHCQEASALKTSPQTPLVPRDASVEAVCFVGAHCSALKLSLAFRPCQTNRLANLARAGLCWHRGRRIRPPKRHGTASGLDKIESLANRQPKGAGRVCAIIFERASTRMQQYRLGTMLQGRSALAGILIATFLRSLSN